MNKALEFPALLTSDELAELLNVSLRTLHRLKSMGKLPVPVRIGSRRARPRWRRDEIECWIEAGCPDRSAWEIISQNAGVHSHGPKRQGGSK